MSRTLITHVTLWGTAGELVTLAPGDGLPEWAESRVGEHCLSPEAPAEAVPDFTAPEATTPSEVPASADGDPKIDESEEEEPEPEVAPDPVAEAVPDFTAPAPARRNSRTRKP